MMLRRCSPRNAFRHFGGGILVTTRFVRRCYLGDWAKRTQGFVHTTQQSRASYPLGSGEGPFPETTLAIVRVGLRTTTPTPVGLVPHGRPSDAMPAGLPPGMDHTFEAFRAACLPWLHPAPGARRPYGAASAVAVGPSCRRARVPESIASSLNRTRAIPPHACECVRCPQAADRALRTPCQALLEQRPRTSGWNVEGRLTTRTPPRDISGHQVNLGQAMRNLS